MPTLDSEHTLLVALAATLLLLTLLKVLRRGGTRARKPAKAPKEALDTVQAWPPQCVRVLTLPERRCLELLLKALPERLVLAQVPLARFISVPTRHSYSDWLSRVGRLSVDLLVCDHSSRVIAAIDIASADESPRSRQRRERKAEVLRAAGVVVHGWDADALPSLAEVRSLFDKRREPEERFDAAGKRILPLPEITEMLAPGDEAAAAQPQFDPVSSSYWDDLDAIPSNR